MPGSVAGEGLLLGRRGHVYLGRTIDDLKRKSGDTDEDEYDEHVAKLIHSAFLMVYGGVTIAQYTI